MKGSVRDLGIVIIVAISLIFAVLISAVFYNNLKSAITPAVDPTNATGKIFERADVVINNMVNLPAIVIILIGISAIVLAFFIPSHPIFLPISFLLWIMYIVLAVAGADLLWEFINSQPIIATANSFPLIVSISRYLPHIIAVIGAIIMIVTYAKRPVS